MENAKPARITRATRTEIEQELSPLANAFRIQLEKRIPVRTIQVNRKRWVK